MLIKNLYSSNLLSLTVAFFSFFYAPNQHYLTLKQSPVHTSFAQMFQQIFAHFIWQASDALTHRPHTSSLCQPKFSQFTRGSTGRGKGGAENRCHFICKCVCLCIIWCPFYCIPLARTKFWLRIPFFCSSYAYAALSLKWVLLGGCHCRPFPAAKWTSRRVGQGYLPPPLYLRHILSLHSATQGFALKSIKCATI